MEPTANPHRDREIEIALEFLARHLSPNVCDHFRRILSAPDPEQATQDIGWALRFTADAFTALGKHPDAVTRMRALAGEKE